MQIEKDLVYLREHRICEKLEYLVKQLLVHQPEDPVLFLCSQLRERVASSRSSGNILRNSGGSLWGTGPRSAGGGGGAEESEPVNDEDTVRIAGERPESRSSECPTPHDAADSPTASDAAKGHLQRHTVPSPPVAPLHVVPPNTNHHASQGGVSGAPSSSSTTGIAVGGTGSLKTSRVTTPAAANYNANAPRASTAPGASTRPTPSGGLERDESVKSDQSYFSIASADMQDFLAEFRAARNDYLGPAAVWISRNDLAEIVDRVNLPLPDVRLIADLFDEMATQGEGAADCDDISNSKGKGGAAVNPTVNPTSLSSTSAPAAPVVPFEAFLARMNFRIQGRYPMETIRSVYFTHCGAVGGGGVGRGLVDALASGATPRSPTLSSSGHSAPMTSKQQQPITKSFSSAPAATQPSAAAAPSQRPVQSSWSGMPRGRALEDALWRGLGLRLTSPDVTRLLATLGLPSDDAFVLQLTDFAALVAAATGQKDEDLGGSVGGYHASGGNPTPTTVTA